MNSDATALDSAISTLRQYYGTRLDGPRERTEAQMRHTLKQQMGLDEAAAGRVLQELTQTGHLTYVGSTPDGPLPRNAGTGPVISMPSTATADSGTPLITTASPDLLIGVSNEAGSDVGNIAAEVAPEEGTVDEGQVTATGGHWRIGET
jgi:hypothetical protein